MSSSEESSRVLPPHPLDALLTPARARRYRQVIAQRTYRRTAVIENCHHPHNAAAVLRTCDAVGIGRVHLVTDRHSFAVNRSVAQGADRYVELRFHNSIDAAYAELRVNCFQIWASDVAQDDGGQPLSRLADVAAETPLAVVFGNEVDGLSPAALHGADGRFSIPMCGFSRSLNLSVAVAVTLYLIRGAARGSIEGGDLSLEQQQALYELWISNQHPQSLPIVESLRDRQGNPIDVLALPERDASGDASAFTQRFRRRS